MADMTNPREVRQMLTELRAAAQAEWRAFRAGEASTNDNLVQETSLGPVKALCHRGPAVCYYLNQKMIATGLDEAVWALNRQAREAGEA